LPGPFIFCHCFLLCNLEQIAFSFQGRHIYSTKSYHGLRNGFDNGLDVNDTIAKECNLVKSILIFMFGCEQGSKNLPLYALLIECLFKGTFTLI
jgi:hypothetical protein